MTANTRPLQFRDYLPEVFRVDEVDGVSFLSKFLVPFETLFEELEAAIEGRPAGILQLSVQATAGSVITVVPFDVGPVGFPIDTPVTVAPKALRTTLAAALPANGSGLTQIVVRDTSWGTALQAGDVVHVHPGGMPDLFAPDTTPPPQFRHRSQPEFDFLKYLANWIALPLRAEKAADWNRRFFDTATLPDPLGTQVPLYPQQRSTLPGLEALLRAWLKDDLLERDPPLLILTDLTRPHTDVDAVFQLGETATLGVNTVLGEGPPFFFLVDLITDPAVSELRHPVGLDVLQRAARFLLDAEKPAHTYYQLRVRAHTIQLAPAESRPAEGFALPYAQIGETTLLWDEPWIFDSDC